MPYEERLDDQTAAGCTVLVIFCFVSAAALLGAIACGLAFGAVFGFAIYVVYLCIVALLILVGMRKSKGGE